MSEPRRPSPPMRPELPVSLTGRKSAGQPGEYCPNCGARLRDRGCKLTCVHCSFFLSCSDFH